MTWQAHIKRYLIILEQIREKHYPSSTQILHNLKNQGIDISKRTLERDLSALRDEFFVDIQHSKIEDGYYIPASPKQEQDFVASNFVNLIKAFEVYQVIKESKTNNLSENAVVVQPETQQNLRGIGYLPKLVKACLDGKLINFEYKSFKNNHTKQYLEAKPYMLKEYLNRWYLIAEIEDPAPIRTFGIDRLEKLEITQKTFKKSKSFYPENLFLHNIGITYSDEAPEEITLSVTNFYANYLITLPWHKSQQILENEEGKTTFSFHLIVNEELIQKILALGPDATVIKPASLREKIKHRIEKTLSSYC
ncbi:MAG: helix-turn-helix transcriptional regulator [Luteibaculaceae bacterium]